MNPGDTCHPSDILFVLLVLLDFQYLSVKSCLKLESHSFVFIIALFLFE